MSTRHVKEKSARYIAVGHTLHSSKYFLTFNLSTHVNVSTNSKYWISLAFDLNSTLSIPAINVIVTPFFSSTAKSCLWHFQIFHQQVGGKLGKSHEKCKTTNLPEHHGLNLCGLIQQELLCLPRLAKFLLSSSHHTFPPLLMAVAVLCKPNMEGNSNIQKSFTIAQAKKLAAAV